MNELEIDMLGGHCPVQATGVVNGEPFYFRARGEHWAMFIGSNKIYTNEYGDRVVDVIGYPKWFHSEKWGDGPFDAGWMPLGEARKLIEKAAKLYLDNTN